MLGEIEPNTWKLEKHKKIRKTEILKFYEFFFNSVQSHFVWVESHLA